jgi:hypothetical protein
MNRNNVHTRCNLLSTIQSAKKGIQANGLKPSLIHIIESIYHMDRVHYVLIIIGLSIMLIMLIFPPFHVMYSPGIEINMGYAFFLKPRTYWRSVQVTVNIKLLLFQIGTVVALLVALQLFLKMYKK